MVVHSESPSCEIGVMISWEDWGGGDKGICFYQVYPISDSEFLKCNRTIPITRRNNNMYKFVKCVGCVSKNTWTGKSDFRRIFQKSFSPLTQFKRFPPPSNQLLNHRLAVLQCNASSAPHLPHPHPPSFRTRASTPAAPPARTSPLARFGCSCLGRRSKSK